MTATYSINWLKQRIAKGEQVKFIFFWSHLNKHSESIGKFCLSQWHVSPFTVDGIVYKTAEHWMMAQKAKLFDDTEVFQKILNANKPGEAKELGRQISNFDETVWQQNRYEIVKLGNNHKFSQNPILAEYLLKTGDRILAEASPLDTIYGIGLSEDDMRIQNVNEWKGLNLLGFTLMETRDFLKNYKAAL